jgi:hypothetical protein
MIPATPIHHSPSVHHRYDAQGPPAESGAHVVLRRFLPHFRHSQFNSDASTELQQHPMQNSISGHNNTPVVEVPEIRDRQVCLVLNLSASTKGQ